MAIFHCNLSHSRSSIDRTGNVTPAAAHRDYIMRENEYSHGEKAEELIARSEEMENAPEWAEENPREFWSAADAYERVNGRTYHEIRIALPVELTREQQAELVRDYCREVFGNDFPYEWAIHSNVGRLDGEKENPHAHIMFNDRRRDEYERTPEVYFSEAAKQYKKDPTRQQPDPAAHGARKDRAMWNDRDGTIERVREQWEQTCNLALEQAGHDIRIDRRTLVDQRQAALAAGDHEKAASLDREPEQHLGPDRARAKDKPALTEEEIEKIAAHRYTRGLNRELKTETWDLKKEDFALRKEEREARKAIKGNTPSAAQQAELDRIADARHEIYKARTLNELRQQQLDQKLSTPEAQEEIAKIAGDIAERDRQRVEKTTGIKAGREKNAAAIARAAAEKRIADAKEQGQGQAIHYADIFYAASDAVREIDRTGGDQATREAVERLRATLTAPENHPYMPSKALVVGDVTDPAALAAQAGKIIEQLDREKAQRQAIEAEQRQRAAQAPAKDPAQEQRAAKLAKSLEAEKARLKKENDKITRAEQAGHALQEDAQHLAAMVAEGQLSTRDALLKTMDMRNACRNHLRDLKAELTALPEKRLTPDEVKKMAWAWHHENVLREHDPILKVLRGKLTEAENAYDKAIKATPPAADKKLENLATLRDAAAFKLAQKMEEIKAIAKANVAPVREYAHAINQYDSRQAARRATVEQKIDVFSTKEQEFQAVQRALSKNLGRSDKPGPNIADALHNIARDMGRQEAHGKGGLNLRIAALHQELGHDAGKGSQGHGDDDLPPM